MRALPLALVVFICAGCARGATSPLAPAAPPEVEATIAWRAGPKVPSARDHHATFVARTAARPFLYVVGGSGNDGFLADAWRAPIASDGSLGAWQPTTALPGPRAGMGVVATDDFVLLTAGKAKRAKEQTREAFVADVGADGALSAWREAPPLPEPRFHLTTMRAGDFVYAIGGLGDDMTSTKTVYRAKIAGHGIEPWQEDRALPDTRSHHASFVHGGYVYVAGGLRGNPSDDATVTELRDVLRAKVGADGALGPWEPAGELEAPLATEAAVVVGDTVILAGGLETDVVATVRRARFGEAGALGPWEHTTPLPRARAHMHQTPVFDGFLYAVGGNGGGHHAIDDVSIGTLR